MLVQQISNSAYQLRHRNQNQATTILNKLQQQPQSLQYYSNIMLNKSTIDYVQNHKQQSIQKLKKCLQIDSFDYKVYYNLFVIYCRSRQYASAYYWFKRCVSVLYCLSILSNSSHQVIQDLQLGLQLWDANTVCYALKIIYFIKQQQLQKASEVIELALRKSIQKHHIFALCCAVDSRLNREAQRDKNARSYHNHLLRRVSIYDQQHNQMEGKKQQEVLLQIGNLINKFNQLVQRCSLGQFRKYEERPDVIFVEVGTVDKINLELQISNNLGPLDLVCINEDLEQQKKLQQQEAQEQQIKTASKLPIKQIRESERQYKQDQNVLNSPRSSASKMKIQQILASNEKIIQQLTKQEKRESRQNSQKDIRNSNTSNPNVNKGTDAIVVQSNQVNSKGNASQNSIKVITNQNQHAKEDKKIDQNIRQSQKSSKSQTKETNQQARKSQQKQVVSGHPSAQQHDANTQIESKQSIRSNEQKSTGSQKVMDSHKNVAQNKPVEQDKTEIRQSKTQDKHIEQIKKEQRKPQDAVESSANQQSKVKQSGSQSGGLTSSSKTMPTVGTDSLIKQSSVQQLPKRSDHAQQQQKEEDYSQYKKFGDGEQLYPRTHPNFQVKLILANLQISQQLFGKMDPYVYYEYGGQKHKSTIAKGQGMNPRWENQIKVFSLEKNPTVMKVSVYDREIFKWDDLVGATKLEIDKTGLFLLPIYLNDKKSGEVMFHISKTR